MSPLAAQQGTSQKTKESCWENGLTLKSEMHREDSIRDAQSMGCPEVGEGVEDALKGPEARSTQTAE